MSKTINESLCDDSILVNPPWAPEWKPTKPNFAELDEEQIAKLVRRLLKPKKPKKKANSD